MLEKTFWVLLGLIFYTLLGYPLLVLLIGGLKTRTGEREDIVPEVSVIIAAYNEENTIEKKLKNTLALDYPSEKMEIIVASDGSRDRTNEIVTRYSSSGIKLVQTTDRVGKTEIQNRATEQARGKVLLFTDATALLAKDAVRKIVRNFSLPGVGCVSGRLVFRTSTAGTDNPGGAAAGGMNLYCRYQEFLRRGQTRVYTMLGATGCIYAIRKNLFQPVEKGLVNDFAAPMMLVEKGYRVVYEPEALAVVERRLTIKHEFGRRSRIALQGWIALFSFRRLLNPFRHPFLAIGLISRWLLRRLLAFFLIAVFILNVFLAKGGRSYCLLLLIQVVFYLSALAGLLLEKQKREIRLFHAPLFFCVANAASLAGIYRLIKGEKMITWSTERE